MGAKVGTPVLYTLTEGDAQEINRRRRDATTSGRASLVHDAENQGLPTIRQQHIGNHAAEGDQYPAVIVRVFDPSTTTANLQVHLDGNDTYWATSRQLGDGPGRYQVIESN